MAELTLKGTSIHTNGSLPIVGSLAPDFVLIDQNLNPRSLNDFVQKRCLLSIVPSLDTSVCLTSAKTFNQLLKGKEDLLILFISADLPFAQKRICGLEKLDQIIPLSMMRDRKFAKDYGVLIIDGPLQGLAARALIAIDKQQKIIYSDLIFEVSQEPDYEKAMRVFL